MSLVDDELLAQFIRGFYGYGNLEGNYWLMGMEESGGNSCEEVQTRLTAWEQRGKQELEDIAAYHNAIGAGDLFQPHPRIQPTWGKLIRLLLSANGEESVVAEQVRDYQREHLARPTSDHCILELFPLPSPSTNHWLYDKCSNLPYLGNRDHYRTYVAPFRVAHLQSLIQKHRPPCVIFYSFSYRVNYWEKIAGVRMKDNPDLGCALGRNNDTMFAIIKHPATKGISSDYYHSIGRLLRRR
jgi:hypothetical protein